MKRFEKLKMTLFDSTNANFRLGVEGQFTRNNPDGSHRDLVYVSNKMVGYLNPNIYLTLEYKNDENPNAIYTSYPQLFKLRSAFGRVKDILISGEAFTDIGGELKVNAKYGDPVVISGIGKNNNWVSIRLCVITSGENGVSSAEEGVSIELSTAEKFVSVFNVDEFLTLYTIINDIDLAGISASMSLAFLECDAVPAYGVQPAYGYAQPQYQPQPQPQYAPAYGAAYPQPQTQGYVAPHAPAQAGYTQPKYNNTPRYQQQGSVQQQRQAPRAAVVPQQTVQQAPVDSTPMMAPRAQKPIMNLNAVEDTPVSETYYDDSAAIDEIFED